MLYLGLNCLWIGINVPETMQGRSCANFHAPEAVIHLPALLLSLQALYQAASQLPSLPAGVWPELTLPAPSGSARASRGAACPRVTWLRTVISFHSCPAWAPLLLCRSLAFSRGSAGQRQKPLGRLGGRCPSTTKRRTADAARLLWAQEARLEGSWQIGPVWANYFLYRSRGSCYRASSLLSAFSRATAAVVLRLLCSYSFLGSSLGFGAMVGILAWWDHEIPGRRGRHNKSAEPRWCHEPGVLRGI